MTRFVLDASVALAWAFEDEVSPYAAAAIRVLDHERAIVPRIWSFEISNALILAVRRKRIDELLAYRMLRTLHRLPIDPDEEFADPVLGRVTLRFGIDYSVTAYDSSYLELAVRRGLPLATQDSHLAHAAAAAGVNIFRP